MFTRLALASIAILVLASAADAACPVPAQPSTTIQSTLRVLNDDVIEEAPASVKLTQYAGGIADYLNADGACVRMGVWSSDSWLVYGSANDDLFVTVKDGKVVSEASINGTFWR